MPSRRMNFRPPPDQAALRFLKAKSLKLSFNWKEVYAAEHAYAFTVAKVESLDLLSHFSKSLEDALASGKTFQYWKKEIDPILHKSGWVGVQERIDPLTGDLVTAELGTPRRLRVIFDTNMRQARHAGQWERVQDTKTTLPYLQYRTGPSENHRPEHASWDGLVLPVDDPWWDSHHPQNGWGCKCWVKQLTATQARKAGIGTAPPSDTRSMVNKRTGEVVQVPLGIDPGFEYNPGKQRAKIANAFMEQEFKEAPPALARAAIGNFMADPNIREVMRTTERAVPVGYAPEFLMAISNVKSPLVLMSARKANIHVVTHGRDVPASHYQSIPDIIDHPHEVRQDDAGALYLIRRFIGLPELVILRPTEDFDKYFMLTTYRIGADEENRQRKKTSLVWQRKN